MDEKAIFEYIFVVPKLGICPILRLGKPNLEFQVWVPILRLGKRNLESAMLPNLKKGSYIILKLACPNLEFLMIEYNLFMKLNYIFIKIYCLFLQYN